MRFCVQVFHIPPTLERVVECARHNYFSRLISKPSRLEKKIALKCSAVQPVATRPPDAEIRHIILSGTPSFFFFFHNVPQLYEPNDTTSAYNNIICEQEKIQYFLNSIRLNLR